MIIDHIRDLYDFQEFFYAHPMPKEQEFSFLWVIKNPNLFCFYDEVTGEIKAYIVMCKHDDKLYLSGASCRKNMPDNIQGIIKVCNAFNEDIYSYTKNKCAKVLLNKAGFKKINEFEYVRYKNGQE